ncbi:MAG: F0F1 ATP synthase subunit epsilon [Rhizobiaceae bacterium]|jgi:F-type H+-transporting ATPase subunit epsilon|nr:F0F1 ATP synthase subunit epsilon [Rhizobiaceae bacterium]
MSFQFELVAPEALILSGEAEQVVVPGVEGYFTVLADHAPFMSTVKPGIIDVQLEDGTKKSVFVRGGFADVSPDGLTVLAEHAVFVDDFDLEAHEKEIEEAREAHAKAEPHEREEAANLLADLEDSLTAIRHAKGLVH